MRCNRISIGIPYLLALTCVACAGTDGVAGGWPAEAAAKRLGLEICQKNDIEEPLLCGRLTRPARPGEPAGPTIDIAFVVVPAKNGNPDNLAWTEHQGGPGRTLLTLPRLFAAGGMLEPFREARDVFFVDQRGVGESQGMHCTALTTPRVLRAYFAPETVRACREELEAAGLLDTDYSTIAAVDDLDAIRELLGYERLDLGGWSYGSRYMLTYASRHPDHVRTISVFVPTPIDYHRPVDWARFSEASLEGLFSDCAEQPACATRYPDLPGDWRRVLDRVERNPPILEFVNPFTSETESVLLSTPRLIDEVHTWLLKVSRRQSLPNVIHSAAAGDFGPFLELAVPSDNSFVPLAEGTYLSIVCPEETAFIDPAEAERLAAGTFLGMHFVNEFRMACAIWDRPPHPDYPLEDRTSSIPLLVVAGGRDPITPIEYGERIAANFTRATVLSVEQMPHNSSGLPGSSACFDRILLDFITRGSMDGIDIACVNALSAPPFVVVN